MPVNTRYRKKVARTPASNDNAASDRASIVDSGARDVRFAIAFAVFPSAM
jgi:hypothetical protein